MNNKSKINLLVKQLAQKPIASGEDFLKLKQKLSNEISISPVGNIDILNTYKKLRLLKKIKKSFYLEKQLKKRPVRSLSGVAVVAVLTKPWPCPGKCIYCPTEKNIPKSYLAGEPAVERALTLKYNPYQQVKKRIEVLEQNGHPTDKIELIVIGGTWSYLPKKYQYWFIKRCFDGANGRTSKNLAIAQKVNERAHHRIIGLTLETRPDFINPKEIIQMRELGCTRVEIGVQAIDDKILKKNQRGHNVQRIIEATKLLKDAGFKICYHIMPGLYGSSVKKDLAMFKRIFDDPNFRPDMLKIYPCVVTRNSKLYKIWKQKKYKPYSNRQLIDLIVKMKLLVPHYVRINRVIRDIPSWQIRGGSKISNLREVLDKNLKKLGKECQCIRCREIKDSKFEAKNLKMKIREYSASGGKEIFLSCENFKTNKLAAFLRLRISKPYPIIREVHTYGELIPISKKSVAVQHLGFGKKLMREAEEISEKLGYKKIAVIAGVGVREYYRKLGYKLEKTYMVKSLTY
ncbi:MAG: tRNA uridine(34) 5-carboxymethylaminomethyl modification radical SAM/GNAT enzyme Elp3 [Patescibacteria group bacterium]|nr:tRNA uridine(34) 5-carboxymethylaminomethyl modification radical SAM/GNAT enzyme Elp3 [Patescibacteria group bacterium]MDD5164694.1 tRNA uridine(34) 5-carboxymethylaminomethyl modification radical SAM/GNAT enzyme Elp3 [Patescibacteria group bacterium]MDD5534984.1 tRNA uridine(34) 5-carboxymethylaminomethyl modification radical SAM/GNAT enzyme Elp3 [Patescibacteria group bacterium]